MKIIAFEGTDASGKETQALKAYNYLKKRGLNVAHITFPDYESEFSIFVKSYLGGKFGDNATDIPAKVASLFFSMDRYAKYRTSWPDADIIIADRYVGSNMCHQASKLNSEEERISFMEWLDDMEYNILGLPRPSNVIFLNMPPTAAKKLMENRSLKNKESKDIHENDSSYMLKSYNTAIACAQKYGWHTISCEQNGIIKAIDDIAFEVSEYLDNIFNL